MLLPLEMDLFILCLFDKLLIKLKKKEQIKIIFYLLYTQKTSLWSSLTILWGAYQCRIYLFENYEL